MSVNAPRLLGTEYLHLCYMFVNEIQIFGVLLSFSIFLHFVVISKADNMCK